MAKKRYFSDDEVPIFENRNGAVVYKRGEYWQFRVWLTADNKYVQKSLNTKIRETAIERGQKQLIKGCTRNTLRHSHSERSYYP
jgi:hypothetical protein